MAAACAGIVGTAEAVHWPNFGGDAGRSGNQPVDEGGVPVTFQYNTDDRNVRTSIITSAGGGPDVQKVAYGTSNGFLFLRTLANGALPPGTPSSGAFIDDGGRDADVFGSGSRGSVTPVDTSTVNALGNVLALHNDDNQDGTNDIAIAVVPEGGNLAGVEIKDLAVPNTNNFTVNSSPVISPPDSTGERSMYFIADRPTNPTTGELAERRLYKVDLANPSSADVTIVDLRFVVVTGATRTASPALLFLPSGDGARLEVAVPFTSGNTLRTFVADDTLAPSRQSGDLGDDGQTPSVPVRGQAMAGQLPSPAPAIYQAVRQANEPPESTSDDPANDTTITYELTPSATNTALLETTDRSTDLPGFPAPALAVSRESEEDAGRVVVTTAENLFSLRSEDLVSGARLAFNDGLTPGGTGFGRTTAAISGDFTYVARDNGRQLVLRTETAQPVEGANFTEDPRNAGNASADPPVPGTTASFGQPSISRRFIQFGSDLGLTVYRAAEITFSVNDVEIAEGNSGTRTATLTVSLSQAASDASAVTVRTADGTATTADGDYVALPPTTVNFAAGETQKTVTVTINGDTKVEPDEAFVVLLSDATGGPTIADGTGQVTIVNDDGTTPPSPSFSVGDAAVSEGNDGTVDAVFNVTKSGTGAADVRVSTADGTAEAPADFTAVTGEVVSFAADETSKTVAVAVNGDTVDEPNEEFFVNLTAATAGSSTADDQGRGVIADDDDTPPPPPPPAPAPRASIADVSIGEGDQGTRTATLTVSLDRPADAAGSVDFATANGTALSPGDYVGTAGTVGFERGEQSKQVTVPVTGDTADEPDETFAVRLSGPSGGLGLADAEGIVTIVDDDKPAVVVDPEPVDARGISVRVSPRRDRGAPFRFRTTGRLTLPSGVPTTEGCRGRVSVQIKALNKTISTRRASLTSSCRYASRVTFRNRKRFTRDGRLKITVRFLGNDRINAIRAKAVNVRTR